MKDNVLQFLQTKFACDNDGKFPGMTNYEELISYFAEVRQLASASRKQTSNSVFGGDENAEHEIVTQMNTKKDKIMKKQQFSLLEMKYDSDSSVPSSFKTER